MAKPQAPRREWNPANDSLETELGNGWMVIEHFVRQRGRRVVGRLVICPAPPAVGLRKGRQSGEPTDDAVPDGGITARLLRDVKLGKYQDVEADYRKWVRKEFGPDALKRLTKHVGRTTSRKRRQPKTRRASDRFYAELARAYTLLWQKHVRSPTAELAALRGVPIKKMRSDVHLARANGFLTETSRGKAGGELTEKAIKELSTHAEAIDREDV